MRLCLGISSPSPNGVSKSNVIIKSIKSTENQIFIIIKSVLTSYVYLEFFHSRHANISSSISFKLYQSIPLKSQNELDKLVEWSGWKSRFSFPFLHFDSRIWEMWASRSMCTFLQLTYILLDTFYLTYPDVDNFNRETLGFQSNFTLIKNSKINWIEYIIIIWNGYCA